MLAEKHYKCNQVGTSITRKKCLLLGLSKDLSESTHPLLPTELDPPPTELTALAVDDGFHSPKPKINGSEIGSPPLKSKKPDPTDPSFSKQVLRFFWVDPASFEFSLGRFKLDSVRFHQIQPRSCQKWLRSRWIWRDLAGFLPFFKIFSSDSAIFQIFLAGFSPFSK